MSFLFFFLAVMLALLVLRMLPLLLTVVGVIWLWGDHRLILIACIVAGIGEKWLVEMKRLELEIKKQEAIAKRSK